MALSLFVKNLPPQFCSLSLYALFSDFGVVKTAHRARSRDGTLCNHGYVSMFSAKDAENAIEALNGLRLSSNTEPMFVTYFVPASERYVKLYVSNIDPTITREMLGQYFSQFGPVTLIDVHNGRSFGFIHFKNSDEGKEALLNLNGRVLGGRALQVRKAHSKRQIEAKLAQKKAKEESKEEDMCAEGEEIFPDVGTEFMEGDEPISISIDVEWARGVGSH